MLDTVWASLRNYSGGCNVGCRNHFLSNRVGTLGVLRRTVKAWFPFMVRVGQFSKFGDPYSAEVPL